MATLRSWRPQPAADHLLDPLARPRLIHPHWFGDAWLKRLAVMGTPVIQHAAHFSSVDSSLHNLEPRNKLCPVAPSRMGGSYHRRPDGRLLSPSFQESGTCSFPALNPRPDTEETIQKNAEMNPDCRSGRGVLFSHSFLPLNQRFRLAPSGQFQALIP